jgi:glycosyltransferase involved in cell wall biosynthesis
VQRILFVIPSLDYGGAARQLILLAAGLPGEEFARRVCVLGEACLWADALRGAGVEVDVFDWRHLLDPGPLLGLRRAVRAYRPDVLHAWQLSGVWLAALAGRGGAALVASWPFRVRQRGSTLGRPHRLLLARCAAVTVPSAYEAERCRRLGLPPDRVVTVPPGVAPPAPAGPTPAAVRAALGLPDPARLIAGVGPLEPHKGFRDAVWALDMLRGLYGDLHLLLIGRGPDRFRLEQFSRAIGCRERVHFACPRGDVVPLLAAAEVVWVPDRVEGSLHAALEAMMAGRPVVASRLPGLAEVVADGETGLLFPPGDKAALARQTRRLLDDAALRQCLGEAGRRRAVEQFGAAAMVRRFAEGDRVFASPGPPAPPEYWSLTAATRRPVPCAKS